MSNRLFFVLIGLAHILFSCRDQSAPEVISTAPNIIWLVAEDQSAQFFPMYGDKTISLPNLEELAKDAMLFTNAFAPVPVCAPSRSALITGMYPSSLGTHNMRTYNAYRPENEKELGIPSYSPVVPQDVKAFTEHLRKAGYYCTNNAKEDYNFKIPDAAWDISSSEAHWRNRKGNTPFFSVFNFGVCHESGIWGYSDSTLFVSPKNVPVPPYFPDTDSVRHDLAVNYSNLKRLDDQLGKIIDQLKEDGLYKNAIIFFYSDHGGPFPRHKRSLKDSGTQIPLLVKLPGGERATEIGEELISFIDFAPTVLSLAGIEPPKVMQGKAFLGSHKSDVIRTHIFSSSDRFDEVIDRQRAVRTKRFKYIRNFLPDLPHALPISYRENMPMMRKMMQMHQAGQLNDAQGQWFTSPKAEEELYDLHTDPFELENLAVHPSFKDTLLHLRSELEHWMLETKDLGGVPEQELLARWTVDGKQEKLPLPTYKLTTNGIVLNSKVSDATLLWRLADTDPWQFYSLPLGIESSYQVKSSRIGYEDSDILHIIAQ